ncbi:lon protease homolog, mitochondrial [Trichomonascus vanleenenianus]|uniref:ATP-dependent Lon protease PIM1 n=1 Tax=Trichomonascus vanleenenianus TaxID=2268995 RepID=UPI003EC96B9B
MITSRRLVLRAGLRSLSQARMAVRPAVVSQAQVLMSQYRIQRYSTGSNGKPDSEQQVPEEEKEKPIEKLRNTRGRQRAVKAAASQGGNDGKGNDSNSEPPASASSSGNSGSAPGGDGGSKRPGGDGKPNSGTKALPRHQNFGFRPGTPEDKKQVLSIMVSDRPAIPGYHRACRITDQEVIYAIRRIFYDSLEDQCIAVFLKRPGVESSSEVIKDKSQVYPVGSYCRIGGVFSRYEDGQEGCTITLLPLARVDVGDLIEQQPGETAPSQGSSEPPAATGTGAVVDKNSDMDVTSFDTAYTDNDLFSLRVPWMKNIKMRENEPYDANDKNIQALCAEIIEVFRDLSAKSPIIREQLASFSMVSMKPTNEAYSDPAALADLTAAMSEGSADIQEILSLRNVKFRLEKALELINKEMMQMNLQDQFKRNVDAKLQNRYKKVYLEEKMAEIKKELGHDTKEKSTTTFKERAAKLKMPEQARKAFEEEIAKLESTDPSSVEHSMTRNYVDWLTQVPWGVFSEDKYDIKEARKVLDQGHYGLKDVKDRILEFIATARLSGSVDGKIICFCGPPGVGKTSIGKSIAEALGRKFTRISVGGIHDVSEIKGHRRTYVGAVPGRVIQALKLTKTQNPLILIDEIDKVGHLNTHGDPSAALLELLDPEQNSSFVDTFLDVPIDVSKVLFVCTANYIENIPAPLKDRMEVIDVSGYVSSERVAIAEQYLIPNSKKGAGLDKMNVDIDHKTVEQLVHLYSRENGVRGLKKLIEKIHRKVALKIVEQYDTLEELDKNTVDASATATTHSTTSTISEATKTHPPPSVQQSASKIEAATTTTATATASGGSTSASASGTTQDKSPVESWDPVTTERAIEEAEPPKKRYADVKVPEDVKFVVDPQSLKEYLGPPKYLEDRMYEETPAGVVMGLAYTEMGGVPLYVESVLQQPLRRSNEPKFARTGQLGEVMNESSTIAYSFCRMFMSKNFPKNRFFDKAVIHLHCPEGAIKKDGPSAGVTMTTSLLSLALNHPLDATAAMTGEMTLTGKVLRIGGLKEKVMAAKLAGAKTVFFPYDNVADWENMPDFVKEGVQGIPVKWYDDIFNKLFSGLDREAAQTLWKHQLSKKMEKEEEDDD